MVERDRSQTKIQSGAWAWHPGQPRLQKHTHNISYLLLLLRNIAYAKSPHCYAIHNIASLV